MKTKMDLSFIKTILKSVDLPLIIYYQMIRLFFKNSCFTSKLSNARNWNNGFKSIT